MLARLGRALWLAARRSDSLRAAARLALLAPLKSRAARWLAVEAHDYGRWRTGARARRLARYQARDEPDLLQFLTTVWDTPLAYLRPLATSILEQRDFSGWSWVVLDNGSSSPEVRAFLEGLAARDPRVVHFRVETNAGIVGGMRLCLERATARYVLPVDSDDLLEDDAARVIAATLQAHDYPAAIYSDEDQLLDGKPALPFFKPDWDPVMLLDSAYIAHLCAFERRRALDLGVYGDPQAEGCHDWDTFLRLTRAGVTPVHVPEVLYSWRQHAASTAGGNVAAKGYIHASQRHVLRRHLAELGRDEHYHVEPSPLFAGTPDWRVVRTLSEARPLSLLCVGRSPTPHLEAYPGPVESQVVSPETTAAQLAQRLARSHPEALVLLCAADLSFARQDWWRDAHMLFELFSDTAGVTGPVIGRGGRVVDGERVFGFGNGDDCPAAGARASDVGYFARAKKHHSVGALSTRLALLEPRFLREALATCPGDTPVVELGGWISVAAARTARRLVYSPFLVAHSTAAWPEADPRRRAALLAAAGELVPEVRYYPRCAGLTHERAFMPVEPRRRDEQLGRLRGARVDAI